MTRLLVQVRAPLEDRYRPGVPGFVAMPGRDRDAPACDP